MHDNSNTYQQQWRSQLLKQFISRATIRIYVFSVNISITLLCALFIGMDENLIS